MIRIVQFLKATPSAGREGLRTFLRDHHGPTVAGLFGELGFVRHVVSIASALDLPEGPRGPMAAAFDALWELWFEHEDKLAGDLSGGRAAKAFNTILADRHGTVECEASPVWIGHEYPQIGPSPDVLVANVKSHVVKTCFALKPRAELGEDRAQRHWRVHHGPLVRSHAQVACIAKYVQVHRYRSPLEDRLQDMLGAAASEHMGHVEAWFDRRQDSGATDARATAGREIIGDERLYIDFATSSQFEAKEFVFADRIGW